MLNPLDPFMNGVSAAQQEARKTARFVKQWKQMGAFMQLRRSSLLQRSEKHVVVF